ncbi:hypothetical protein J6590_032237 [Homalodisca vitripennis]|nr:hypothetical protein J6590_032237 [Homalodisca vitripennis]
MRITSDDNKSEGSRCPGLLDDEQLNNTFFLDKIYQLKQTVTEEFLTTGKARLATKVFPTSGRSVYISSDSGNPQPLNLLAFSASFYKLGVYIRIKLLQLLRVSSA